MPFSMGEKLRIALKRRKMSLVELADILGTSNQNLSAKLARDNLSEKDLQQIAEALGARFEGFFVFDDETI